MLAPLGFSVREAASGRECLAQVHERCPDAILLDVNMDDIDGWETSRLLRERGFREVPVIMISADLFENRPERIRAAQCQAFVGKPVIESELLDKLRLVLDLEWTTGVPLPEIAPALPPLGDLPPGAASEMLRLARLGYVRGIREVIEELIAQDPRMRRSCAPLKALLDRFDLESFIQLLKEKSHAYEN
jgi:CheY-like chemotaxis protein